MPVNHLYVFLRKISIQILCPFFKNWIMCFFLCWVIWVLCIFWILTLYQIYIIFKYLFPTSRWPFNFVDSFLHCAKAFLLQCSLICLFFSFVSLDWGDTSKKILLRPDVKEWTAFIFPVSIMVSGLTFMSWINLKFIFCAWYDRVVQFGSVGYLSKENKNTNWKRYMHPSVHCSIIYNSQDMEAT